MPTITGTLADFGLRPLAAYQPTISFIPSGPAVGYSAPVNYLLATRPYDITCASDGTFTIDLVRTDVLRPATWYTIRITWLNGSGIPVGMDFPGWKLFVPNEGGSIVDLIEAPWNPVLAWVGSAPPVGPASPNTLWLNPDTGTLSIWSN